MTNKIRIKRGTSATPKLDTGEIAINLKDKKLSVGNVDKNIDFYDTEKIDKVIDNHLLISVKDYGVKGDGVNDDTQAIETCLEYCMNNGKTMYFPNGTYLLSKSILPVPTKDHVNKNKLVSILGESHLGVIFKNYGSVKLSYGFDFKWCNKVHAENLSSPHFTFNTLDNTAYWQGAKEWALALREKDFYLKNLIYTGDDGSQSYYLYINSPAPKDYGRHSDGNYAKYPLEITNGGGYNAININNFSTNEDGSIGSPQDNSAIGIVDRTVNSTGVIFVDMIGERSFERYTKREAEVSSEIRPLTVWEINQFGHIAIGCSTDVNDPVAKGWGTIKMRDKTPKIEMYDANKNNEKYTIAQNGKEFTIKCDNVGFTMSTESGKPEYNGFRWGGINGGVKVNQDTQNPVETSLVFDNGNVSSALGIDDDGELRIGSSSTKLINECSKLQLVHGGTSYYRPKLSAHWRDVGQMYFDTNLNKPIWWNGTSWVDANGSNV